MGTPQNFSATADDSERESKLGIGPFDFSKIWQLLDTTDQNYSKNQCLTERNCYSGILLHAFFDSPQVRKPCQLIILNKVIFIIRRCLHVLILIVKSKN